MFAAIKAQTQLQNTLILLGIISPQCTCDFSYCIGSPIIAKKKRVFDANVLFALLSTSKKRRNVRHVYVLNSSLNPYVHNATEYYGIML